MAGVHLRVLKEKNMWLEELAVRCEREHDYLSTFHSGKLEVERISRISHETRDRQPA